VFVSERDGNPDIYLLDLNSGSTKNFTPNGQVDYKPTWADEGHLAFVTSRDGNFEIYLLDITTGELTNLSNSTAQDTEPAWLR
jgi:TolB protein